MTNQLTLEDIQKALDDFTKSKHPEGVCPYKKEKKAGLCIECGTLYTGMSSKEYKEMMDWSMNMTQKDIDKFLKPLRSG